MENESASTRAQSEHKRQVSKTLVLMEVKKVANTASFR